MTKEELQGLIKEIVGAEWKDILIQQTENQQKWIEKILADQRRQEQKAEKPNVGRLIRALAAGKVIQKKRQRGRKNSGAMKQSSKLYNQMKVLLVDI